MTLGSTGETGNTLQRWRRTQEVVVISQPRKTNRAIRSESAILLRNGIGHEFDATTGLGRRRQIGPFPRQLMKTNDTRKACYLFGLKRDLP